MRPKPNRQAVYDALYRQHLLACGGDTMQAKRRTDLAWWKTFGEVVGVEPAERVDFQAAPKVLADVFKLPPEEAVKYLESLGYKISGDATKTLELIRQRVFTITKVLSAEVLNDVKGMLETAMKDGETFDEFRKKFDEKLQKRGWKSKQAEGQARKLTPSRLKVVFRNNLQTAYNNGRVEQMKRTTSSRPLWQYLAVVDRSTTDVCRDLHGKVFWADDPIWNRITPPNHHNCRATIRSMSERDAKRYGIDVSRGTQYEGAQPDESFANPPSDTPEPDLSAYPPALRKKVQESLRSR
jgi:SPP1 gp7 family putative phage head morphogenesis protein